MTHDEKGEVINTVVVDEPPAKRNYIKRPTIKLMYCKPFNSVHRVSTFYVIVTVAKNLTVYIMVLF